MDAEMKLTKRECRWLRGEENVPEAAFGWAMDLHRARVKAWRRHRFALLARQLAAFSTPPDPPWLDGSSCCCTRPDRLPDLALLRALRVEVQGLIRRTQVARAAAPAERDA